MFICPVLAISDYRFSCRHCIPVTSWGVFQTTILCHCTTHDLICAVLGGKHRCTDVVRGIRYLQILVTRYIRCLAVWQFFLKRTKLDTAHFSIWNKYQIQPARFWDERQFCDQVVKEIPISKWSPIPVWLFLTTSTPTDVHWHHWWFCHSVSCTVPESSFPWICLSCCRHCTRPVMH